eukprot:jgi/Psemu1/22562/gm1.22562_g
MQPPLRDAIYYDIEWRVDDQSDHDHHKGNHNVYQSRFAERFLARNSEHFLSVFGFRDLGSRL